MINDKKEQKNNYLTIELGRGHYFSNSLRS